MKTVAQLQEELDVARETIRQLTEPIVGVWYDGFQPSHSERIILDTLLKTHGPVGPDRLRTILDAAFRRVEPATVDSIAVTVHRLRNRLVALKPSIKVLTLWGEGFYLDDENRARLMLRRHNTTALNQ